MFEIRVNRSFEASHAIRLPDGALEATHRHAWSVQVTVGIPTLDSLDLVMDFHELEARVSELAVLVDGQDLNRIQPFDTKRIMPTAERVAWWFATELAKSLPNKVCVTAVEVEEAPGCIAVYRPA